MKKRFWVFAYNDYYPIGGMNDFKDRFYTVWEVNNVAKQYRKKYDDVHCLDIETEKVYNISNEDLIV